MYLILLLLQDRSGPQLLQLLPLHSPDRFSLGYGEVVVGACVVDGDGLQESAGGVRAVPHLQEGAVVQAGHEVYKVESQDVSSLGVELLLARPAVETIIPAC